jgi:diadenosine tetraphosphate (Ap4A) HIT family hydrolase
MAKAAAGMKGGCVFCEVYTERRGIIAETEHFFSQLDKFPVSPGHAEVIPKRHVDRLLDLSASEWSDLMKALRTTEKSIEGADLQAIYSEFVLHPINGRSKEFCTKMLSHVGIGKRPEGYNYGINDSPAAGRTVEHLHVHVIPRYSGDVPNPRGGIRHMFPGMGDYR